MLLLKDFMACLKDNIFSFAPSIVNCGLDITENEKGGRGLACLWIVSDYNRASSKCLFSYIALVFTLQITTPFHLHSQVDKYVKYKQFGSTLHIQNYKANTRITASPVSLDG